VGFVHSIKRSCHNSLLRWTSISALKVRPACASSRTTWGGHTSKATWTLGKHGICRCKPRIYIPLFSRKGRSHCSFAVDFGNHLLSLIFARRKVQKVKHFLCHQLHLFHCNCGAWHLMNG